MEMLQKMTVSKDPCSLTDDQDKARIDIEASKSSRSQVRRDRDSSSRTWPAEALKLLAGGMDEMEVAAVAHSNIKAQYPSAINKV